MVKRTVDDLDLWVYTPNVKSGAWQPRHGIHVIYGHQDFFHNINSRVVIKHTLSEGMNYGYKGRNNFTVEMTSPWGQKMREAEQMVDNFDLFLDNAIGTHDRRIKRYKEFAEKVVTYKAYVMKRKLQQK